MLLLTQRKLKFRFSTHQAAWILTKSLAALSALALFRTPPCVLPAQKSAVANASESGSQRPGSSAPTAVLHFEFPSSLTSACLKKSQMWFKLSRIMVLIITTAKRCVQSTKRNSTTIVTHVLNLFAVTVPCSVTSTSSTNLSIWKSSTNGTLRQFEPRRRVSAKDCGN